MYIWYINIMKYFSIINLLYINITEDGRSIIIFFFNVEAKISQIFT